MSPSLAAALVLGSALLHAGWNTALRSRDDARGATALVVLVSAITALLAALAFPAQGAAAPALAFGLLAGLSEGIYFVSLSRALEIGPLGAVYAVSRGAPLLLLWPASHLLLGEALSARAAAAVALLLAGLLLLAPLGASRATSRAGYLWSLCTALFNAGNALLYKAGLSRGAAPLWLFATAMLVAAPLAFAGLRGGEEVAPRLRRALGAARLQILLGGAACTLSFLLVLLVLRERGAAWVMTLRNTSIAFAPLSAWLLLRERLTARAGAGIALVFAAAALLGW